MKAFSYASGHEIRVGDRIRIKRLTLTALEGVVLTVFDPAIPADPEENDYGFAIRLKDGTERWYTSDPGAQVTLLARK